MMKFLAAIIIPLLLSACQLSIIRPDYAPVEEAVSYVVPPKQEQLGIDVVPIPVPEVKPKAPVRTVVQIKPKPVVRAPAKAKPVVVETKIATVEPKPKPVVAEPKLKPSVPVVEHKNVAEPKPVAAEPAKILPPVVAKEPEIVPPAPKTAADTTVNVFTGLPKAAVQNLPLLASTVEVKWPDVQKPSTLAGQIEQETCPSLTHSKCFTSRAELKTSREWGVSFGQFTIAYDKQGRERFNAFEDVKKLDRELEAWQFSDRYNEKYGMMAFVVRMKSEFNWVKGAQDFTSHQAFALSGYNGGRGGVLQDRRLCAATKGCNPDVWYDNVEKTSYKSRVVPKGYGQSMYHTNRGYVDNVQNKRSKKYVPFMREALKCQTNC